jgi:hypothetical protein
MFLYYFDALMSKIIFKNKKKYYFDIFPSKKYFKKQPQPQPHSNWKNKNLLLASFKKSQKVECGVHYSHQDWF